MNHPVQCIATVETGADSNSYLLAACASKLLSICLTNGDIRSEWSAGPGAATKAAAENEDGDEGRPAKKQKTATNSPPPNVIRLTVSPNNQHAVAVTDDKYVRVFEIHDDGTLLEISERAMPKRPCAIQILPDNATILCGDKFGDVYSLPLLPTEEIEQQVDDASPQKDPEFKPSATNLTVHTQRNRKALEAQLKQKNLTPKTKEPLKFQHQLLLSHVSMLTDVAYANLPAQPGDGGSHRGYIVTADRDEHIRASRAPPQSHIIEGYCLGHKEFVSKIRILRGAAAHLLVSGGGDDWIGVWDWPSFKLRWKFDDFRSRVLSIANPVDGATLEQIAVSGIWVVPGVNYDDMENDIVVIACEKVPVLAYCPVSELLDNAKTPRWSFELFKHPILDVVSIGKNMLVSFDSRGGNEERVRARHFRLAASNQDLVTETEQDVESKLQALNAVSMEVASEKNVEDLLYGVANLRKRGYQEEAENEDVDGS